MSTRAIITKLIKALFSVALLMSLSLYPPSSAHAHHAAHGVAAVDDVVAGHHGGHGTHAHHDMGDAHKRHLNDVESGKSSDTPECCKGICIAAVIAQAQSGLPHVYPAGHEAGDLSDFSTIDPIDHGRPPKHLI